MKNLKKHSKDHLGFIIIMIVFLCSAVATLGMFYSYTDQNIDFMKASVVDIDDIAADEVVVPSENLCDPFCLVMKESPEDYLIFDDVDSNHRNAVAIETFHDLGIIQGYEDGTFRPDTFLNRAEYLKVVTTAVDADFSGQVLDNCFLDVNGEWFAPFVCFAFEQNWVQGYEDGNFLPGNYVSRSEALKMALAAFDYEIPEMAEGEVLDYLDIDMSHWYVPYLKVAAENGIISDDGRVGPLQETTRGEFMQLMYNAMHFKGLL